LNQILIDAGVILLAYVIGSVPFGLLIVKLRTGKDIREIASGRTGGTNAMRAAGFWAGIFTALFDILKGASAVWIAQAASPHPLLHALAPVAAILGHNHSIFLPEFDENRRFKGLRGGAGGAPSVGGAFGLWPGSLAIILPLGALIFFTLGYASVTTMSVALFAVIIFSVKAIQGSLPWVYVLYGVLAEALLVWALRPNLKNLLAGTERVVGISLHGWLKARRTSKPQS